MAVRTFYWHTRVRSTSRRLIDRARGRDMSRLFRVGNAGDLFNRDVIEMVYDTTALNVRDDGRRLLCIGSVAHLVKPGDIVCGIGTKGGRIPDAQESPCTVLAVRGPITLEAFARAGHDVSTVRSQLDPGLLIRFAVDLTGTAPTKGRVAFVPHYRERGLWRRSLPRQLTFVDVDSEPTALAREIARSEFVYTSSLHGVIFAHALGRPCVLVQPRTQEPTIKYEDYFASVNLTWRRPLSLEEALRSAKPTSPPDLSYQLDDFALPTLADLRAAGIAT